MNCFECEADASQGHDHHVVPRALGGTKTVRLCVKCHGLIHGLDFTHHGVLTREGQRPGRERGVWFGAAPMGYKKDADGRLVRDEAGQSIIAWVQAAREARIPWREIIATVGGTQKGWHGVLKREQTWRGCPPSG
jgi:hypothetical protein